MKVIWGVLCRDAVVDRQTNNVSLINVIEEVTVAVQPPLAEPSSGGAGALVPVELKLVTLWARSNEDVPERGYGRIRILLPDHKYKASGEFEVDMTQYLRFRNIAYLPGLPFGGPGTYKFVIEEKGETENWSPLFELPLRFVVQTQESG